MPLNLNPRGSAPTKNHSRPDHRLTYSSAARQGIQSATHSSHEPVLNKSHPSAANVQQVVLPQSHPSQVSPINPGGAPMPVSVANAGSNQYQVIQTSVPQVLTMNQIRGYSHQQTFAPQQQQPQQSRAQPRPPLMSRAPSGPPNAAQQPTQTNMHNMPQHSGAQQIYYVTQPTQHNIQSMFMHNQHITHPYTPRQAAPTFYMYQPTAQPQYGGQHIPQYVYPQHQFPAHHNQHQHQGSTQHQIMPSAMHQSRVPAVTAVTAPPVIQSTPQLTVQMAPPNNDMNPNESSQMPPKQYIKREKRPALLQDPSGNMIDLATLAKDKSEPKEQTSSNHRNKSHPGASIQITPNLSEKEVIQMEFTTSVSRLAAPPNESLDIQPTTASSVNETDYVDPKADDLVAKSESISETNDKNGDISDSIAGDDGSLNNDLTNSEISSSNSNFDNKTDSKLLNDKSAQNILNDVNSSQIKVELNSVQNLSATNGQSSDTSFEQTIDDITEKTNTEIAKDYSQQEVIENNNNIIENINESTILVDEKKLGDNKVNNCGNDVTDNVSVVDKLEVQPTIDESLSVIVSSNKSETVCNNNNNISDNNIANEVLSNDSSDESNEQMSTTKDSLPLRPNLPYKDGQWTPVDTDGIKNYDRDFLMAVLHHSQNADIHKMPECLKSDKIKDIQRKDSSSRDSHPVPYAHDLFLPQFAKSTEFRNRINPPLNRGKSQSGKFPDKQRKIISTSLTQDVKLHTTGNAWKPMSRPDPGLDNEEQETQDLLKKIRGILNKLTPQKFNDLSNKIMGLKFDTEDRLRRVLDLIFEKAVDEPAFCVQYANLCKHLSLHLQTYKVFKEGENGSEEVKFYKLLLTKCQKEFEADIYATITDLKERQEVIDKCMDQKKKKELWEILDDDKRRARKRSLGNIKLIGELYKLHMLKANIMLQCIENLIKEADDESLECLCYLFRTIGEQIENEAQTQDQKLIDNNCKPKYMEFLNSFFIRMEKIANQKDPDVKGTSSRVRFMLKDINDMRKNNWKVRRDENLPKTIEEIHKDAQKEDEQKSRDLQQHTLRKHEERKKGNQNDANDGNQWKTVTGRKSQNAMPPAKIDFALMKNQMQSHDNIQLGPMGGIGNWSLGSRGGGSSTRPTADDKQPPNRFSPLDLNDNRKQSHKTLSSRDSSKGRSNQQHGYSQSSRSGGGRSQTGGRGAEKDEAISLARSFSSHRQSPSESSPIYPNMTSRNSSLSGSREASAPNSRSSSIRRETPDIENQLKGSTSISDKELGDKCIASIQEYLNVKNFKESVLDVTTVCHDSNVDTYVTTALNIALDNSSQTDHFLIGKLINHLLCNHYIKLDHFFKGLNAILEMSSDIEIDVPKMWDYIAEVIAPVFVGLTFDRKKFLIDIKIVCEERSGAKFIAKIIKSVSVYTNEMQANELWQNSDLSWTDFLDTNQNVVDFVSQYGVEFTTKQFEPKLQTLIKEVEQLVKNENVNEINNIINKHFNTHQKLDPPITSALFSAIINGCINAPQDPRNESFAMTVDISLLTKMVSILNQILDGNLNNELQALKVLTELMERLQHPSNLLSNIFNCLYDTSVISHEAFLKWEETDKTSPGKAMAITSVVRFMTWLRENEDDDDDNDGTGS
ncbi:eukaryotic translation initiation factor 4 gamma 3-like isoform X2 [Oppia nitens]|uniref:eukaryotic translation initiation factor 4 gamma 3-like isoform X2 n=1 Tax=Oppia nitens TaxID=1686743 RepID=UPI0023DA63AE|nr:eukaryotic translation initiation factor 4 gamma 3-like isoform X2 [Oppia nitens]